MGSLLCLKNTTTASLGMSLLFLCFCLIPGEMLHDLGLRRHYSPLVTLTLHTQQADLSAPSLSTAKFFFFSQGRPICVSGNTFPSLLLSLLFNRINSTLQHAKRKNDRRLTCCEPFGSGHVTETWLWQDCQMEWLCRKSGTSQAGERRSSLQRKG